MNANTCDCGSTDLKPNRRSVGAICQNCYQAELTKIEEILCKFGTLTSNKLLMLHPGDSWELIFRKGEVKLRLEARYSDRRFQLIAYRQDNSFLLRDYPDFCTIKTLDGVLSDFLSLF
ncbi:MAG: hypothetical protein ACFFBD_25975 [Candidatus Hodarchaeota archaeon]